MTQMSLRIEGIEGNVGRDEELGKLHAELLPRGGVERVAMSRRDATKNRQRVTSDKGREVIIDVPRGITIGNGDVLSHDHNSILVVEWMPEETLILTIERSSDWEERVERATRLGYLLGMKHFHPFLSGSEILVPVEENSKEEMLKLFGAMKGIKLRFEKRILEKSEEAPSYEHHS
jgi:urease accessory protein UreE